MTLACSRVRSQSAAHREEGRELGRPVDTTWSEEDTLGMYIAARTARGFEHAVIVNC